MDGAPSNVICSFSSQPEDNNGLVSVTMEFNEVIDDTVSVYYQVGYSTSESVLTWDEFVYTVLAIVCM